MNWIDTMQSQARGSGFLADKSSRLKAVTQVSETETIFNAPKRRSFPSFMFFSTGIMIEWNAPPCAIWMSTC
ncbi:MAG: hypothetical protein HOH26_18035 [Alphaproteobacteria bacterium]|nr:hypothetical protein [Alphaproteobacteria bacterium]